MDNSITLNRSAMEAAVTALVGAGGAIIMSELYTVIAAAEARGENRGHLAGFRVGYDLGIKDGSWIDIPVTEPVEISEEAFYEILDREMNRLNALDVEVPEDDIREPRKNAHVEGAPYVDTTEIPF